ncbi:MAG TPA: hypothetical protein PKV33_05725 [Methanothrix sp.]|nr:hypothetical protein [Methanothrix sp.]
MCTKKFHEVKKLKKAFAAMLIISMALLGVVSATLNSDLPNVPPGPPTNVPGTPDTPNIPSPGGPDDNGNQPFIVPPPFNDPDDLPCV